ncbi:hypothetical protein ACFWY9_42950 [Amycolatopsis sp. NPDC059027]|uniref:hypothetical protein n=1 Tax=Amycolatopsis sp. NPDC059027 TaxID=3346709 RepID=UPI00366A997D
MARRRNVVIGALAAVVVVAGAVTVAVVSGSDGAGNEQREQAETHPEPWVTPPAPEPPKAALALDTGPANRRPALPGLPDWSKAGYREGKGLPGDREITPDTRCRITPATLAERYQVKPGDNTDDSDGLQRAIDDVKRDCSPAASYERLSLISLPAGVLDVTKQLSVDADYLVIRGAGADPASGTRFVFRPGKDTRYDKLDKDGASWDQDAMKAGDARGGWIWPGRGLFRVQSREVHPDYRADYASAPANRKDLFEGTVNVHWKAGAKLAEKPGDAGFSARTGETVVHLDRKAKLTAFRQGGYVNVRAANSTKFYEQQQALPTDHELQNLHMRQQIFGIAAVDEAAHTLTLDKPLEFDVPVNSTSDGSPVIEGKAYDSKAAPLADAVLGVGLENFHISQDMPALAGQDPTHEYGNLAPAEAMHGIVLKWAVNAWVRGIATYRTGSHPIVTEEAKNIEVVGNSLDGAWNKGKGGNGYLRGSRVWDSVYAGNVTRNLRHFTLQWSASDNVVIGNDFDSDVNLHGGWERRNLFELNTVRVPAEHQPGNCHTRCGGEGGANDDETAWFPIWWGAGKKAVKWSGATGPQNVFFGNTMTKQTAANGPFVPYYPDRNRVYQFGWDGAGYRHLAEGGTPIPDWASREQADYTGGNGVDATRTDPARSLFLKSVP